MDCWCCLDRSFSGTWGPSRFYLQPRASLGDGAILSLTSDYPTLCDDWELSSTKYHILKISGASGSHQVWLAQLLTITKAELPIYIYILAPLPEALKMAANYWESTQRRHWQFTRQQLEELRQQLEDEDPNLVKMYPLPEVRHQSIYFNQQVARLGKRLGLRQQAMATAQLYIRRFYSKVEIRRTNPYLVMATAVYLACKMEESPHHIRLVVAEGRALWTDFLANDTSKLGECEFFLISEMSCQMIVHHPYRSLTSLQGIFSLTQEESNLAWSIINDHYMTDLPLLFPPHIIAIMSILLALVLRPNQSGVQSASGSAGSMASVAHAALSSAGQLKSGNEKQGGPRTKVQKLASWLAESNIDIEAVVDCTQEIISFYETQEQPLTVCRDPGILTDKSAVLSFESLEKRRGPHEESSRRAMLKREASGALPQQPSKLGLVQLGGLQ
ncbi:hypothetical protein LZ554_000933 [Drepanopeziza brunnea f. sp. 'monogermtubi']|nr:hypothetical protein LZ554_000933 [Drepanopeziza brunnea f. sp. 'monogermtubi']